MAILLVKSAKKQGECVATRPTQPRLAKRKLLLFFQHLSLRLKILFDQCQPTPFFGGLDYFNRRYFIFEKDGKTAISRSF